MILHDIENEVQYQELISQLDEIYKQQFPFCILIETAHVKNIHMKYLYQFGSHLNGLKSIQPRYLQYTTIHVYDDLIYNLLYTLFIFVAKPIAKVTVIYFDGGYEQTHQPHQNIKKIKHYFP